MVAGEGRRGQATVAPVVNLRGECILWFGYDKDPGVNELADETFRLPASSFEVVQRILEAYVACGRGPVKLDDVANRAAMQRTLVSSNNAFLTSVGLLEGGNLKSLTDLGREVGLAASHPGSVELQQAWRKVVDESEHLQRIVDAVRIRRGMTAEALITHIILTAGVPKSTYAVTGARALVDLLEAAGKLEERDGTLRATTQIESEGSGPPGGPSEAGETKVTVLEARHAGSSGLTLNITVNIAVEPGAMSFEELVKGLHELVQSLQGGGMDG
jgi:hypothetical protein